ncbi:lipopolysaccharide biosynthesis protein [Pseudomonas urmiensis]|uniref:lipopolysaccharide biosynthesis protein n=1 Tax=Pseudomonas urmiensis TaxID=2745493 RepID=UPI003CA83770
MEAVSVKSGIPQSSVKDFASSHNIAKGPVFIVASGASAKGFPLERFADVPMITMNGAISMFAGSGVSPFFYVCSDTGFPKEQPDLYAQALQLSHRLAIWPDEVDILPVATRAEIFPLHKASKATLFQAAFSLQPQMVRRRALWGGSSRTIGFSKDLSHGFFDARTVAYVALQIAYHVGFTKVFLVGVDLNPSAGRFYENGGRSVSPCGLDDHFERRILPSLELMSKRVMGETFAVYNLSKDSKIPQSVIPKITLDQAESIILSSR